MAKFNSIRENEKQIRLFLNIVVDESSPNNWRDLEHVKDFKTLTLHDYFMFQHDLHQLNINENNSLWEQYCFGDKIYQLSEKFKKEGVATLKADIVLDMLCKMITDWFQNDRDIELKKQEKEHYTIKAFLPGQEEKPSFMNHGLIAKQKEIIDRNKHNKINFG